MLFINILEAVMFPTTETLPELYIDPVKISVSALIEKDSPCGVNILVDPVTVKDPDITVLPVTFKVLLEYTKFDDAVAALVVPSESNTLS